MRPILPGYFNRVPSRCAELTGRLLASLRFPVLIPHATASPSTGREPAGPTRVGVSAAEERRASLRPAGAARSSGPGDHGSASQRAVNVQCTRASSGIDVLTSAEDRGARLPRMAMQQWLLYTLVHCTQRLCPYLPHGHSRGGQRASRYHQPATKDLCSGGGRETAKKGAAYERWHFGSATRLRRG